MKFPAKVLQPIKDYLETQRKKLIKRKKDLAKEDPFSDSSRVNDNAAIDAEAAAHFGNVGEMHVECDRVDAQGGDLAIDEMGFGAAIAHRVGGRDEGQRWNENLVVGSHAGQQQAGMQR